MCVCYSLDTPSRPRRYTQDTNGSPPVHKHNQWFTQQQSQQPLRVIRHQWEQTTNHIQKQAKHENENEKPIERLSKEGKRVAISNW